MWFYTVWWLQLLFVWEKTELQKGQQRQSQATNEVHASVQYVQSQPQNTVY